MQEGDLRLAGSAQQSEGRVEIYHDGQWGTVCDDGWDLVEAQVVCRQLKFPGAKSVVTGEEIYGTASGPIWMDDMECNGAEKYLHSCKFKGWGVTDCSHKEDVGVVCETGAEGTLSDLSHILDHRAGLSDELGELFIKGTFCDLSVTAQSPSPDDQTTTLQTTDTTTLCAHRTILSLVDAFNITENTSNITVEVVQSCLSYFPSFIRYLYTRKIEVTYSSVQCLHWLSSKFGVEQLKRDTSLLFNRILPDDSSFETSVSVHEYASETKDVVLKEICVQYMAWNFQNFSQTPAWTHISVELLSSLLARSDLVVPDEWFVLKAVENWILNSVNVSLDTKAKILSLVRFPMIPAEQLTMTFMLSNSSLYSTHKAVFDANILKALQFNVQLFTHLKSKEKMMIDDVCYQSRIYTMWSIFTYVVGSRHDGQRRSMSVPYHSSLIFEERKVNWVADLYLEHYQCSNHGMRCPFLPMARMLGHDSKSQPAVVFHNRLLLICEGRFIGHVQDFKDNVVYIPEKVTQSITYPCRHDKYNVMFVVRPEFI